MKTVKHVATSNYCEICTSLEEIKDKVREDGKTRHCIKSKDREGERSMSRATDYSTGYADGKRAGLLGASRCMHMMIDTQRCTSLRYFRGFEAGFRDGLAAIGLEPEVSRRRA